MRGRVMGIYMLMFLGGAPIGSTLTGLGGPDVRRQAGMVAGGIIAVVATVIAGLWSPGPGACQCAGTSGKPDLVRLA